MPYCPKCGNHYYVGTSSCSTCGESLTEEAKKTGDSGGEHKTVRKQERDKRCPYCNSTGKVDGPIGGDIIVTCPVCRGKRYNLIPEDWIWCKECNGTGEFTFGSGTAAVRKPCPECKGTGWLES
jgi:hypothetical protein